jgi:glycine cleavage system regulatory protein
MTETLVISFIGQATPNDVHQLATITHENGGKWLVSKVNFIDDQVAAVIKIQVSTESKSAVIDAFQSHPRLTSNITKSSLDLDNNEHTCQLRLDANDRAGIVNDITHLLDSQRIRVLDLNCQRVFISGHDGISSTLFTANISVKVPPQVSIYDVTKELEALSEDTKVMIEH